MDPSDKQFLKNIKNKIFQFPFDVFYFLVFAFGVLRIEKMFQNPFTKKTALAFAKTVF